ncbi:MAG: hypothetical protein HOA79_03970 [Acidiferrobacteraceae bacterium]|jgi:hypothetical protein|nr:hypothetical protein [Acidiferrobacteraceae bacterium]MBT6732143.1 hypothetical protein [Acidiferrobacteraceae bacterium]
METDTAFRPALNSVGIAQACEKLGPKAAFLANQEMHERLQATSAHRRSEDGPTKAAAILDQLLN